MKKFAFAVLVALCPLAFAYDPELIENSSASLAGALAGIALNLSVETQYIPGFGLQFITAGNELALTSEELASKVQGVFTALGDTVQGLEPTDKLAYANFDYYGSGSVGKTEIVVITQASNLEDSEVWINGDKQ